MPGGGGGSAGLGAPRPPAIPRRDPASAAADPAAADPAAADPLEPAAGVLTEGVVGGAFDPAPPVASP